MSCPSIPSNTNTSQTRAAQISCWIIRFILPVGWLALLTGLFWIGDRSYYHKLYYALLAGPALIALLLQPHRGVQLLRHPLLTTYLLFAGYTCLTILWSDSETQALSLIKRPIYVLILLLSAALLAAEHSNLLTRVLKAAAVTAVFSAVLSYGYFLYSGHGLDGERFSGYGALYNPLLSAHVYGFFAAFWLASWFVAHKAFPPGSLICLGLLGVVIIATGSRTPLLALSVTALWLCLMSANRRSVLVIVFGATLGLALLYLYPTAIISRGFSYRPDIWAEALKLANEQLLLGHGYDHQLMLELKGTGLAFNDPHNVELAVLLAGGLVGLALWVTLYAIALCYSWRNRHDPAVLIASALLVFGLAAGLTEGRAFLSRPKEHWFLIWIPFALLISAWLGMQAKPESFVEARNDGT